MKIELNTAHRLVRALDDAGFNDPDAPVSGADTVDLVCAYLPLLNALPALAELALAVEKLVGAKGRFHAEQNYRELAEKLQALKELP